MGVFDHFHCQMKLPEEFYMFIKDNPRFYEFNFYEETYHTKSISGGSLDTYKLDDNGQLYVYDPPQYVKSIYSGLINIYTLIYNETEEIEGGFKVLSSLWIEFNTLIDRGKSSWIEVENLKYNVAEKGREKIIYQRS